MTSNNNLLPPANPGTTNVNTTRNRDYVPPDSPTPHPDYTHMHKDTTTSGDDRTRT